MELINVFGSEEQRWKEALGVYKKLYIDEDILKEKMAAKEKKGKEFMFPIIEKLEWCCDVFKDYANGVNDINDDSPVNDLDVSQSLASNEIDKLIYRIEERNYQNPIVGEAYNQLLELKDMIWVKDNDYTRATAEIKNRIPQIRECAFAVVREDYLKYIMEEFIAKAENALQVVANLDIEEAGKINHLTQNTVNSLNIKIDSVLHTNIPAKDSLSSRSSTKASEDKGDRRESIKDKLFKNLEKVKKNTPDKKESEHDRDKTR